jgi:hypothetical protein
MIEQMKQWLEAIKKGVDGQTSIEMDEAITSLRQAIAELESQEPVAYLVLFEGAGKLLEFTKGNYLHGAKVEHIPLYTNPPQRMGQNFCPRCGKRTNDIHTCTPPQRSESSGKPSAWVGLTDYEIGVCSTEAAMNRSEMVGGAVTFARAIEAKLKEKNNA